MTIDLKLSGNDRRRLRGHDSPYEIAGRVPAVQMWTKRPCSQTPSPLRGTPPWQGESKVIGVGLCLRIGV